jgi:hypothetical protein
MAHALVTRCDINIHTPENYAFKSETKIICFIGILPHTNIKQFQQTLPERANSISL